MKTTKWKNISPQLGLGLIGIGREWGHKKTAIPSEQAVQMFLRSAFELGIRYFDTAASYGVSEERLGKMLAKLDEKQRDNIIVATKFGENWNTIKQEAYVDHSYEGLRESLDCSLQRLKKIDLLYLHKATIPALKSPDVAKAFAYAKAQGITDFGASVSDQEAGEFVCQSDLYSVIQFPYNVVDKRFDKLIDLARASNKIVVINRPFNMGGMLYAGSKPHSFKDKIEAYTRILQKNFRGAVLTGTKSISHLEENLKAFQLAKQTLEP